jgi:hypothetical protein
MILDTRSRCRPEDDQGQNDQGQAPRPPLAFESLGPRPTDVVCVKDVDDGPLDRGEDATGSFATATSCTKRWCGEANDK